MLRGPGLADEDDRLGAVHERAAGELVDGGRGDVGSVLEGEVVDGLGPRELGIADPPVTAPVGAVVELGLDERPQLGEMGLVGARCLLRHRPGTGPDGRHAQLLAGGLDGGLQCLVARGRGHRPA